MAGLGTVSWLSGLTLASVLAALGVLIRISAMVGVMKDHVDTLWDWWLHDVTHVQPRELKDVLKQRGELPGKGP